MIQDLVAATLGNVIYFLCNLYGEHVVSNEIKFNQGSVTIEEIFGRYVSIDSDSLSKSFVACGGDSFDALRICGDMQVVFGSSPDFSLFFSLDSIEGIIVALKKSIQIDDNC